MLGRHARIHLQQHRISWVAYGTRNHIVVTSLPAFAGGRPPSRRQFSVSTVTDPINKAVGTLPDLFQHTIPETILSLSESWVPASLPTYTTGIFVFAVLTRLCFFTPWAYWARKRKWRIHEEINPRVLAEFVHGWGPPLRTKLTREKVPPSEVQKIISQNLDHRRNELVKAANLTMPPTIVIPALFTLPVFILATSVMYSTATLPQIASNPMLNEMFISLTGTGQDIAPALPIAIGVVSLLSLEVGTWSPKAIRSMQKVNTKEVQRLVDPKRGGIPNKDTLEIKPNAVATGFFRFLALVRVPICVALPGTVNIYWFTSTLFGLVEASMFTFIENIRAGRWGRNSPILKLPPSTLKARGYDLSSRTPLERAGVPISISDKPLKKERWSLERAARGTFIAGFKGSQMVKGTARIVSSTVFAAPHFARTFTRWVREMGKYYRKRIPERWKALGEMNLRDYLKWFANWRTKVRDASERRWIYVVRFMNRRFNYALIKERRRKGQAPPEPLQVKWLTKAQRKERKKEQDKIRYIMMAKMNKKQALKHEVRKVQKEAIRTPRPTPGLQPPRIIPKHDPTPKKALFA